LSFDLHKVFIWLSEGFHGEVERENLGMKYRILYNNNQNPSGTPCFFFMDLKSVSLVSSMKNWIPLDVSRLAVFWYRRHLDAHRSMELRHASANALDHGPIAVCIIRVKQQAAPIFRMRQQMLRVHHLRVCDPSGRQKIQEARALLCNRTVSVQ
jgi:hypothetical protein